MFYKEVLEPFLSSMEKSGENNAYFIDERFYTYHELAASISQIRTALQTSKIKSSNVGLVVNDDLETYASIFAIWLEGLTYVPLHPQQPIARNFDIIEQAEISMVLDSCLKVPFDSVEIIATKNLTAGDRNLQPKVITDDTLAYILFTSGTTGKPKGVPITRGNLANFIKAFWDIGYLVSNEDRVLQPFELTFDLSVMSYLVPAIKGACVYLVPQNKIKYSYIAELLEEQALTVALMVPSIIRYLQPYFSELELPTLKYSLFCGEALPLDLVNEWSKCIPNAIIDNVYGPTEDTIFCTQYRFTREGYNKSHNGTLSIGKSMTSGSLLIVDENNNEVPSGNQGELCLSGSQLTPGYWNNPEKNNEAFFVDQNGQRFYRTGDICFTDSEGDIMYCGRKDSQVKIQGFRVELGEIEFHAQQCLEGSKNVVAICRVNKAGTNEIALFVEGGDLKDNVTLNEQLKLKLPTYMIPGKIVSVPHFPLNVNGKTDRNELKKLIIE